MVTIEVDEVFFNLKREQDFTWLKEIGKVFCVFDENDSGNVSFGVENGKHQNSFMILSKKLFWQIGNNAFSLCRSFTTSG